MSWRQSRILRPRQLHEGEVQVLVAVIGMIIAALLGIAVVAAMDPDGGLFSDQYKVVDQTMAPLTLCQEPTDHDTRVVNDEGVTYVLHEGPCTSPSLQVPQNAQIILVPHQGTQWRVNQVPVH